MKKTLLLLAALATIVLMAAGCGGGGKSSTELLRDGHQTIERIKVEAEQANVLDTEGCSHVPTLRDDANHLGDVARELHKRFPRAKQAWRELEQGLSAMWTGIHAAEDECQISGA